MYWGNSLLAPNRTAVDYTEIDPLGELVPIKYEGKMFYVHRGCLMAANAKRVLDGDRPIIL